MATFLRNLFDGFRRGSIDSNSPYRVVEVRTDHHIHCSIIAREDCLVLYSDSSNSLYETVLQKGLTHSNPNIAYSLHRTNNREDAEVVFLKFREKLPVIVDLFPEMRTRESIQSISDIIRNNPGWTLTHIAAHFGQVESLKSEIVARGINDVCTETMVTPLHVAIKVGQLAFVQALISLDARLDILDNNGDSVYHYAAITNKDLIQALASNSNSALINLRNNDGHTPLHLACLSDLPECVKELLRSGADVNIAGTNDEVPLQCAVETSSARCVKEIIDMYPNQLYTKDMKNGGTPLHWAKTQQCLEALIEYGCKLDSRNFKGDTALHIMIEHGRTPCAMTLLSNGANPDLADAEGNTPLHVAVKAGNITLVQAFIIFGADINAANNLGETPRHLSATGKNSQKDLLIFILHSVGATRCTPSMQSNCLEGCSCSADFDGIPPENFATFPTHRLYDELIGAAAVVAALGKISKNVYREKQPFVSGGDERDGSGAKRCNLLCLDGGGIKGLVLIQMLWMVEKMTKTPIIHCFDWIAGTSTGGILALALATGKTVAECRCLYFRLKDKVFVGTRPYASESLEKFLQTELGETTTMADIAHPRVLVTGVLADRHPAELHIFRNYEAPKSFKTEEATPFKPTPHPSEQLVWRAARSTGAAPTYFRASGRFLDGGLIANNPTLDALTEIHQCNLTNQAMLKNEIHKLNIVVSMGTGKVPVVPVNTIDVFRPDTFWGVAKMALGASLLGQLLVDQVTQSDGRVVERAQAWCSMVNVPYFRLNPPLFKDIALDETDTSTLVRMLWEVTAYMHSKRRELEDMAKLITL